MGKIRTSTEVMAHISSIVDEVATNISYESNKLIKTIDLILKNTNQAVKCSDDLIKEWENQILSLRSKISDYRSERDCNHSYQVQIDECQEEINVIYTCIKKERIRNNELRITRSQFMQQSSQTLSIIKQTNLVSENANTSGKQYLAKKINIISNDYEKVVTGATALGVEQGLMQCKNTEENGSESGDTQIMSATDSSSDLSLKSFGTGITDAQSWGSQAFQRWNDSLSIVERQAIIDYKKELFPHESSYYVNINNTLRGKDTFTNGNYSRYTRIHNALSRASIPSDVTVYRAISHDAYENMILSNQLVGREGLRDNGFMSCSLVSDNIFTNNSEVILRLVVPEGSRGAYIGNIGSREYESECEILLDCGSTVFVYNTIRAPRSTLTGSQGDTDMITIVDGIIES